jgi:glucose/arabinose dehydrogenase
MIREYKKYLLTCLLISSLVMLACGKHSGQGANGQSASELPAPYATASSDNGPKIVPQPAGAQLHVPSGFVVEEYASDFKTPRWMVQAPNGDVLVSEVGANRITLLRGNASKGKPEARFEFATGLNLPFGMAFHGDYFYVANTDSVVRFPYKIGQTQVDGPPEKILDLPGKGYNQHWTRNILFSPGGKKLYVTVGSETNVDVESDPRRAAISEYDPDGGSRRIYASGLRNPVGLAFYPGTDTLWTSVNERDALGDDLVPDYVTSVRDGGFYGWPYYYIGAHEDPRHKGEKPDLASSVIVPDVLLRSHSAALGLIFYTGSQFPGEYDNDALVALHGSWNRAQRVGYKVVRIHFKAGKPVGEPEDFLTGWLIDPASTNVWGRPVGLLQLSDGSLLVADDGGNKIWRVSYKK